MIETIFTLDYELYGDGQGSLKDLVYEPAEKLRAAFAKKSMRFVAFIEAAELEMIEAAASDPNIELIKRQISNLYQEGHEIGLHLHPQWYNARHQDRAWALDYSEYSLGGLSQERIEQIVDRSISYLKTLVRNPEFTPFSFRAGNWLFQPPHILSSVLAERGIRVDSSVYKGGLQHLHKLDYRRALKNGYYWSFRDDVNLPDPRGELLEFPIYTRMQPIWRLLTAKRIGLQQRGGNSIRTGKTRLSRLRDYVRFQYPIKFDYCRMSRAELARILEIEIKKDRKNPEILRPMIAIGHTKDLIDIETVDAFLSLLHDKGIEVTDFHGLYGMIIASREKASAR